MSGSARSCGSANIGGAMGLGDVWARTLVYFGIAEEEDWDEDGYPTEDELGRRVRAPERAAPPARRSRARLRRRLDRSRAGGRAADEHPPPAQRVAPRPHSRRCAAPPPPAFISSCRAASTTPSRSPTASRTAFP